MNNDELQKATIPRPEGEETAKDAEKRQLGPYSVMFKSGALLPTEHLRADSISAAADYCEPVVEVRDNVFVNEHSRVMPGAHEAYDQRTRYFRTCEVEDGAPGEEPNAEDVFADKQAILPPPHNYR